ncbi:MAG: hypothetical protein GWN99_03015 [Gemmatimonadetes bacterium]|uniref:Uncharacterized protein n=1 Tax=Candidatus Kutchimonas denitrificans TaxID=3056748 RepID=A0AAE5CAT9_9BACT|nr:hypothetical protein [Gemmatimonadota bacterium]NIR74927.1 hypothetical protein [Candidatus Kutchimonas denitrificans]NIS00039.1 hypothetical protein [Gemmatimonadota bacterium]NIT65622.1 hypothetical protein [Gemmatimonadota bacterium]NIU52592.1 hypothetical protein [Gemmatimonadota bacterium]
MRTILILIIWLAFPAGLAAQEARLDRVRERLPAETVNRIEVILAEARSADIPTDPLLDKALEGAAKGVPAERIVAALSAYTALLIEARGLVGPERDIGELVAATDAVRRGVSEAAIASLANEHEGDISVPLVVLGDLVAVEVPVDRARQVVKDALARGASPDELLAIPAAVRGLVRQGRTPEDAATAVGIAFLQGGLPGLIEIAGPLLEPPIGSPVPPGAGPPVEAGSKKRPGGGALDDRF